MSHTITIPESPRASVHASDVRTLDVALAGCGTVGGELLRLLRERAGAIERAHGVRFRVVRVLVRDSGRPRAVDLPEGVVTDDVEAFLGTEADVVVEAMGGVDTAARIAHHALDRGRAFVTANKALVAARGEALAGVARARDARLAFEASVAGGVPVIRVLREALPQTGVRSIAGVLNGTTNYILTRMDQGVPFAAALAEARDRGFAEADPTRDLNGQDAADKIAILAWQAFGARPDRLLVERSGLLPDPDRIVREADSLGGAVRLLAECALVPTGVAVSVEPVIVARDSPFARAAGEENLVVIQTRSSGTIRLSGPGAGGGPTASALLGDMLSTASAPRPPGPGAFDSAPDMRTHRWALSVRGNGDSGATLQRAAARARADVAVVDEGRPNGTTQAVLSAITRSTARRLAQSLEAAGLQPLLVRYDLTPRP